MSRKNWEEEFRGEWGFLLSGESVSGNPYDHSDEIVDFITTLLKDQQEELETLHSAAIDDQRELWEDVGRQREREEMREKIEAKIVALRGNGGHGNCCMCTECKNYHDDCTCAEIRTLKDLLSSLQEETT